MADLRYEDLYTGSMVVGTEKALAGRLDAAVAGVTSTPNEPRRVTGFMGKCANTGYLVLRVAARTVAIIDLAVMNALSGFAPLDILVPPGQTLAAGCMSSSGTAAAAVTFQYRIEGP